MKKQCESCVNYHYYIWFYENGDVKIVDSCLLFLDNTKDKCKEYEAKPWLKYHYTIEKELY